jgi:hypothetical protein
VQQAPGYLEESAAVRTHERQRDSDTGRAASMTRMIQRQKHRAKFLESQSLSEVCSRARRCASASA